MNLTPSFGIGLRRTPRRVFRRPLGVLCHGVYEVREAQQLSEGGLLFHSGEAYDMHANVVVSLIIRGSDCISVIGTVIYSLPTAEGVKAYGVRFSNISMTQRRLIRNYVSAKTLAEAQVEAVEFSTANAPKTK